MSVHFGWVATECFDIVCDPLETKALVSQAEIGRVVRSHLLPCQEAEAGHPIRDLSE